MKLSILQESGVERSGQESSTQNVEGSAGGSQAKTPGSKTELKRAKQ